MVTQRGEGQRRVAVVTGAARGIGAAIARRLARNGIAVAAVDLNTDGIARTANSILEEGGRAIAIGADVADEAAAARAVERAAAELGPVTVLVNNAGIIRDNLLFKMSVEDWDAVMSVHLRGAFLMTRAAQAHMIEAKWGRIVNLSSTSALGNRGQVNYAAAKAGLQGFTKTLALELGKFGVTANAIAPGFIDTEMTQATADRLGVDFEDWKAAASREIPVGRVGTPEDIAAVAAFLCGEDAGYVSGQVIYVAGGPKA
jgi:3-oxoacyl-[acyl-carrier protein] reductase